MCSEKVLELELGSQYKNHLKRFSKQVSCGGGRGIQPQFRSLEGDPVIYLLNSFPVLLKFEKTKTKQNLS